MYHYCLVSVSSAPPFVAPVVSLDPGFIARIHGFRNEAFSLNMLRKGTDTRSIISDILFGRNISVRSPN